MSYQLGDYKLWGVTGQYSFFFTYVCENDRTWRKLFGTTMEKYSRTSPNVDPCMNAYSIPQKPISYSN